MSAKKQYKQTELGLIPEDWEVKKISKFTQTTAGGTPSTQKNEYWNGDIKWMNSGELNLKKVFNVENKITELGLKNSSTKLIPVKCILIGLAGQGKTRGTVAMNMVELCTNQSIAAIYPNDSFISEFLYYNLDNRYAELRRLSTGDGGRGGLNLKLINSLKIPLPPLPEQKAIADCLSTWDCAIEKQSALINALTDRKKALMQQLLTGKKRLPGFSDEWKEVKLGSICENFQNGNAFSAKDYKKTGIPIVTMGNINLGGYFYFSESKSNFWIEDKSLERYEIKKGDLIIAMTDVTPEKNLIGLTSIIDIDRIFYLNQRVGHIILKPKLADTDFIFYLSQNSYWRNQCKAFATLGVQANLGTNDIKNINIKLPSLSEQTAIAAILATADRELQLQKEKLAQLQIQKKGLMQVLLTGKKRLIN